MRSRLGHLLVIRDEEKEGVTLSCCHALSYCSYCFTLSTWSYTEHLRKYTQTLIIVVWGTAVISAATVLVQCVSESKMCNKCTINYQKATFGFFLVRIWVWECCSWFKWILYMLYGLDIGVHFSVKMNFTRYF